MGNEMQPPGAWQAPDPGRRPGAPEPARRPLAPPPGFGESTLIQPAGGGRPWWRRWWVLTVAGLLVAAGVLAAVGNNSDEGDDADTDTTQAVDESIPVASEAADEPAGDDTIGDEPAASTAAEPADQPAEGDADEPPLVGTRAVPYAIGEPAVITFDTFGDADRSVWTLTVDAPGRDITDAVLAANQFNEPPRDGHVFYGVPITMTLNAASKEPLSTAFNIDPEFLVPNSLRVVSDGLDDGCGVVADEFNPFKEVFVGGSISGVVCYSVPVDEADETTTGILLTVDGLSRDRVFLATVEGIGAESGDTPPVADTTPAGDPSPGSRADPIGIDVPTTITIDSLGDADGSVWTLTVDAPGGDITDAVLAENQFNSPPADGHLFYGVPITLTLEEADKEPLSLLLNTDIEFFAPVSLEIISAGLSEGCGVVPDEFDIFAEVFVGGSVSGVVCYDVLAADADAGILVTLDSIEEGRLFFTTRPDG